MEEYEYVRITGNKEVGDTGRTLHGVKDGAIVRIKERIGGMIIVMVPDKMLTHKDYNNEQAVPYTMCEQYDPKNLN